MSTLHHIRKADCCSAQHTRGTACERCGFYGIVTLMDKVKNSEGTAAGCMIKRKRPMAAGEILAHETQPFQAVYVVRSGSFKSFIPAEDGGEQIAGFYLPGELIGLDAIGTDSYNYSVRALETSTVCELSLVELETLGNQLPAFQRELIRLTSRQAAQEQTRVTMVARKQVEERLAAFLLDFSARIAQQKKASALKFRLVLSREDIAGCLGVGVETVSRNLKRFQAQGLLTVSGKRVSLLNIPVLKKIARIRDIKTEALIIPFSQREDAKRIAAANEEDFFAPSASS